MSESPSPRPDKAGTDTPPPVETSLLVEFLQRLPVPLLFMDRDQRIRFVNACFTKVFGYTPADIPTLAEWRQRAYPDPAYREQVVTNWQRVMNQPEGGGGGRLGEFDVVTRHTGVRRFVISMVPAAGGILATYFDVTERRRAEDETQKAQTASRQLFEAAEQSRRVLLSLLEDQKATEQALRANEERYRNLVETTSDWVWETDADFRLTYSSPRVETLLGYRPEEVLGRTPFDLMTETEAARMREVSAALRGKPTVQIEHTLRHRDGRIVAVETSGIPYFSPDGVLLGFRGMDRDITDRQVAEKTLRLHGAALEAVANAVIITNRAGIVEWANPAFGTLSGWSFEEIVGQNPRILKSGHHDAAFYQQMWAALNAGQVWRGEIVNRRKDGQLRTESMTITPLRDRSGRLTHFIAVKQDITDQKLMEQQFLQAQRMEAIGTLAGGIAHDLNNILAPILMISAVLKDKLASEEDQELVAMTQVSAKRGADIVKQLLAFSRGQIGERATVQLRHLIKEMAQMMRETFPREIDLRQRIVADLWTVFGDPSQLHQVILNLCVNARDAMPAGGRLSLAGSNLNLAAGDPALPPKAEPGPYVLIEVADTGTGIPPEIKHRIFDPFFTTKPIGKGTGLGLSTVAGIVHNHGGFIAVDSAVGQGSTFRVYLPASPEAVATTTPAAPPVLPAEAPAASHRTLLVVDDEREIRDAARLLLQQQHYRVLTATHGEEALAVFLQHRAEVSLVITDLMMPVMGGVALVRALRAIDPRLDIIATSGLNEIAGRLELESLGVADILMKPYEAAALLEVVRRRLSESRNG